MNKTFVAMDIEQVKAVIAQMSTDFDSHDFINSFKNAYEVEYNDLLDRYHDTDDQLRFADAHIARFLSQHSKELGILPGEPAPSENQRGKVTPCKRWKKL